MSFSIICEFNPFHLGHKQALMFAREKSNEDVVVCLMSGNFVQRGEPSFIGKNLRAKWAVLEGADIVIELPPFFACQNAELFSRGSISMLEKLGCDNLIFGSECGDINMLYSACQVEENAQFQALLKDNLKQGLSFVKAKSLAFSNCYNTDLISSPNNVLAIEYIKAIENLNSRIIPHTYPRTLDISSSKIRSEFYQNNLLADHLPPSVLNDLKGFKFDFNFRDHTLFALIKNKLIFSSKEKLREIEGITEGLENNFYNALENSTTLNEFYQNIKSKRHTMAKIKRISINFLLDITHKMTLDACESLNFGLVLATNEKGKQLLKKSTKLNLIKTSSDIKSLEKTQRKFYEVMKKADQLYSILENSTTTSLDVHKMSVY